MKAFRKILLALSLIVVLGLTGCNNGSELAAKRYIRQGEKNAVAYIKDKYGIDAEVLNARCQIGELTTYETVNPTGQVYVTMIEKGNNKKDETFMVYITGKKKSIDGYDTFQYKEIEQGFKDEISKILGTDNIEIKLEYSDVHCGYEKLEGYVKTKYDGTNLKEVFGEEPDFGGVSNKAIVKVLDDTTKCYEKPDFSEAFGDNITVIIKKHDKEQ